VKTPHPAAALDGRGAEEQRPARPVHLLPRHLRGPEQLAANTPNVSFKLLAEVDCTGQSQGVIVAQGSRFGGYSLSVKDGTLTYVYNFLGIPPEQRISTPAPRSGRHIVGVEFTRDRLGDHYEPIGTARLYVDDDVMAEQEIRTIAAFYALCGEGLCIGYDGGDDAYIDVERHFAAAMARD
jgi:hypothetical protein